MNTKLKNLRPAVVLFCVIILCFALAGCGNDEPAAGGLTRTAADPGTQYGSLTSFSAETVSGAAFTQADLAAYELTMVNVWATTCRYCIEEMPALEQLYQQLPDTVNLISICVDADYEAELAEKILDDSGVTFETLIRNQELDEAMLNHIWATPTTVFVDSEGNVVGEPLVGAPPANNQDEYVTMYMAELEAHLALLGDR